MPAMADARTLAAYAANAGERADRYEAADVRDLHALLLAACPRGARALDVGCGSGRDVAFLRREGRDAVGVDASPAMLAEARRRHPECAAHFRADALPDLPGTTDGPFVLVAATAVLMHLPAHGFVPALLRLRALLAPDGNLLVSIPDAPVAEGPDARDEGGRLFSPILPAGLRHHAERLGLSLVLDRVEPDGCGRRRGWRVMQFRLDPAARRSADEIASVVAHDRKSATYKFALLRGLCEIAQTRPKAVRWLREGGEEWVAVPAGLLALRWIEYYWPLVEHEGFVPQLHGERAGGTTLTFRPALTALVRAYRTHGSLDGFHADMQRGIPPRLVPLVQLAAAKIQAAIQVGPVVHAGGELDAGPLFRWRGERGRRRRGPILSEHTLAGPGAAVLVRASLWREFALVGHWMAESLVVRWAELTERMADHRLSAAEIVGLLLRRPDDRRREQEVRSFYARQSPLECTWSGVSLTGSRFEVDHVLPFSVWRSSDLWNLLPAAPAVNRWKLDGIVSSGLLARRRDRIVSYWELLHGEFGDRFVNEVRLALAPDIRETREWKAAAWSGLLEAVEETASVRGLRRWAGPEKRPIPAPVRRDPADRAAFADEGRRPPGLDVCVVPADDAGPGWVRYYPDLRVAAGALDDPHAVDEGAGAWVRLPAGLPASPEHFVARVHGTSMNRVIPDGAWALFRTPRGGSRVEQVVLVRYAGCADPDLGAYTLKRYAEGAKREHDDGTWEHARIVLRPESDDPLHQAPIVLARSAPEDFRVLAELVRAL